MGMDVTMKGMGRMKMDDSTTLVQVVKPANCC